jgi:hypothetical protein
MSALTASLYVAWAALHVAISRRQIALIYVDPRFILYKTQFVLPNKYTNKEIND